MGKQSSIIGGIFTLAAIGGGIFIYLSSKKKKAAETTAQSLITDAATDTANYNKAAPIVQGLFNGVHLKTTVTQSDIDAAQAAVDLISDHNTKKAALSIKLVDALTQLGTEQSAAAAIRQQQENDKAQADAALAQKLKGIADGLLDISKFNSIDDAQYLIDNNSSLTTPVSNSVIRQGLINSGYGYYAGKVIQRMSRVDAQAIVDQYAIKGTMGGKPYNIIGFNGGFNSPSLSVFSQEALRKLVQNGYWLSLVTVFSDGHTNGYSNAAYANQTSASPTSTAFGHVNGYLTCLNSVGSYGYVLALYDLYPNADYLTGRSLIAGMDNYKSGNEISYAFDGIKTKQSRILK